MTIEPHSALSASNDNSAINRTYRLAYSVPEAAVAIGIGKTKLYELIGKGTLPSTLIGKRRIIRRCDLESLIAGELERVA